MLNNPVGYNRVYVQCGDELNYDTWWENLRAGRVVVTNGPLMRPLINGKLPGHIFRAADGETIDLEITLGLSLRDLEVRSARSTTDSLPEAANSLRFPYCF